MIYLLYAYLWIGLTLGFKGWWDSRHRLNEPNRAIHCFACLFTVTVYALIWPWGVWINYKEKRRAKK